MDLNGDDDLQNRPSKRAKAQSTASKRDRRLFAPFRALGIICNHVPFAIQTRSTKQVNKASMTIITCTGKSWGLWDLAGPMRLLFVGPQLKRDVTFMALDRDAVYVAAGPSIHQYVRGREVAKLSAVEDEDAASSSAAQPEIISSFIVFGDMLCAITGAGQQMHVFDLLQKELSTTIQFQPDFTARHVLHPSTYLNKVVVTSEEGGAQIWNVATHTLIHSFEPETFASPTFSMSPITCVVQSPAIDVLAFGFADGRILIFDIRQGDALFEFSMSSAIFAGPTAQKEGISCLSFRTDNVAHTLASADTQGNIALWDLNAGGKVMSVLRLAHTGPVSSLQFLPGQPVLVSAGSDNAVRQWLFDTPTSPPRLLRERSGHASPPTLVRYYGSDGKALLSASEEDRSLRYTSIVRDSRSHELSQGSVKSKSKKLGLDVVDLKVPGIEKVSFPSLGSGVGGTGAGSTAKREWDDILTVHRGEATTRTWSVENKRIGKYRFKPDDVHSTGRATATCVTACGNFGLVGYEKGKSVIMWNMQSGIRRREFKLPIRKDSTKQERHVTGIETDALNTTVVVATLSGHLQFFDFHNTKHLTTADLPAGIVSTCLQRDNNLLACTCDDHRVRLVDIETRRVVRDFPATAGQVLDVAFSHDSRWLCTSSSDAVIRTYDIPTGQLVDAFRVADVASSIAFSPTGDFLATAHQDNIGIFLWANRAQFADVSLRSIVEAEHLQAVASGEVALPSIRADEDVESVSELSEDATDTVFDSAGLDGQLPADLATLSLLPRSKWATLINLEVITARNKPKEPPKAPEQAPFFLPTLAGTETRFDMNGQMDASHDNDSSKSVTKRLGFAELEVESDLVRLLRQQDTPFFERLFSLPPSALDLEIRSLATKEQLAMFLRAATERIRSKKDFEAVQAVLNVFFSTHSEELAGGSHDESDFDADAERGEADELTDALQGLMEAQEQQTKSVGALVRSCLGLVAWARGVPVV